MDCMSDWRAANCSTVKAVAACSVDSSCTASAVAEVVATAMGAEASAGAGAGSTLVPLSEVTSALV